ENGDFYMKKEEVDETAIYTIFGPKADDDWGTGTQLNTSYIQSNVIHSGIEDPDIAEIPNLRDGDFYIQIDENNKNVAFYGPYMTTWPAPISLIGTPRGSKIFSGTDRPVDHDFRGELLPGDYY